MIVILFLLVSLLWLPSFGVAQTRPAEQPLRAEVIAAARDVMERAVYCTFITIGEDGQPQGARRRSDLTRPQPHYLDWDESADAEGE